jgi:hypothetical protein
VPFFSQRLRLKVPFSEVAPCPFEILARTLQDITTLFLNIIYPAMTAFTDQYSLPNIFFDIGQL